MMTDSHRYRWGVNSYSGIPKCLAMIGTEGLEKSGVFRLQNEFNPGLLEMVSMLQ